MKNQALEGVLAEKEWLAWRQFCKQLKAIGINVDGEAQKPLILAARKWGEELAALRYEQEDDVVASAHSEAEANYQPFVIDDGAP